MSHTKGQWIAIGGDAYDEDTEWGVKSGEYWIASCYYSGADYVPNGTAEANARLIAAAPAMLAALELVAKWADDNGRTFKLSVASDSETAQAIAAAIRAAKGGA